VADSRLNANAILRQLSITSVKKRTIHKQMIKLSIGKSFYQEVEGIFMSCTTTEKKTCIKLTSPATGGDASDDLTWIYAHLRA